MEKEDKNNSHIVIGTLGINRLHCKIGSMNVIQNFDRSQSYTDKMHGPAMPEFCTDDSYSCSAIS